MNAQIKAAIELIVPLSPDELKNVKGICFTCRQHHLIRKGWYPDLKPDKCSKCGTEGCSNSVGKCDECSVTICDSCGLKRCMGTHDSGCHIVWCGEHVPTSYDDPCFEYQCSNCLPELSERGLDVKGD